METSFFVGNFEFGITHAHSGGIRGSSAHDVVAYETGRAGNVAGVRRALTRALNEGRKPTVLGVTLNKRDAKTLYNKLNGSELDG